MPWCLSETGYRGKRPDWHYAPGQDLPDWLSLPETIPDKALWPLKIILVSPYKDVTDFAVGPWIGEVVVSEKFRRLVEAFEPGVHHFIPLQILDKDENVISEDHYLFKPGDYIEDGIIEEKSDLVSRKRTNYKILYNTQLHPRIMWRKNKIEGRHVWVDERYKKVFVVSDEFYSVLNDNKIEGFLAMESRAE